MSALMKRLIARLMALVLVSLSLSPMARASLVEAEALLAEAAGVEVIEDRAAQLEALRERLTELGVDAAQVEPRLAHLSTAELQLLEQRLEELPAGAGLLGVLGVVFVVLLVLELVGVIDVFKAI